MKVELQRVAPAEIEARSMEIIQEELGGRTFPAEVLAAAEGDFTPSDFVKSVTGVDNVCERAAVCAGGWIIVPKQAKNGVTVAVARKESL